MKKIDLTLIKDFGFYYWFKYYVASEWIVTIIYKTENIYNKIRDYFFPRQKWLFKKVPNSWCDKTHLMEIVLFEMLIHYVEGEKCFEVVDWNRKDSNMGKEWCDNERKTGEEIRFLYNWIKNILPAREKDCKESLDNWYNYSQKSGNDAWKQMTGTTHAPDSDYDIDKERELLEYNWTLENNLEKEKNSIMKRIIDIREYLWT